MIYKMLLIRYRNDCYREQFRRSGIRSVAGLLTFDRLFNFSLRINLVGSDRNRVH